jgi:hypothetical protein
MKRIIAILIITVSICALLYYISVNKNHSTKIIINENYQNAKITLKRSACFGTCPVYSIIINGDGVVNYQGEKYVKQLGDIKTTIPPSKVKTLIDTLLKEDYLNLADSYNKMEMTDMPSVITSLTINGKTKSIEHYLGDRSAPEKLTKLEDNIDAAVNSLQWIK